MLNYYFYILLALFYISENKSLKIATNQVNEYPKSFKLELTNLLNKERKDVAVVFSIENIKKKYKDFNPKGFIVMNQAEEIPTQADDLNGDGELDEICFVIDLNSSHTKTLELKYNPAANITHNYKKRTQAELSHKFGGKFVNRKYEGGQFQNVDYMKVPAEHTDHSFYIRYEGPGWESDKVGYRFYLDWRNAFDVFGKKTDEMVLQNVGLDGFDSYHNAAPWGQDVFKAGKALGIGAFGILEGTKVEHVSVVDSFDCRIVLNGPVRSLIRTNYYGWKVGSKKYTVCSNLSIFAGSRLTNVELIFDKDPENLLTGIVRDDEALFVKDSLLNYNAFGIYQKCLANDNLGLAVIIPRKIFTGFLKTEFDYSFFLKSVKKKINYSFFAAWEQENAGVKSVKDFTQEIKRVLTEMNSPVKIEIK